MTSVLVVGAGIAGLVGARVLEQAGHEVVVIDKGHEPGGRMATRHPDGSRGAVFDHGAQFVTLREEALADETERWRKQGWLAEWFTGSPDHHQVPDEQDDDEAGAVVAEEDDAPDERRSSDDDQDGGDEHVRYRGAPYQRALPEALAGELVDVRCDVRLRSIAHDGGWVAATDEGDQFRADALLCTPPAPQALELFEAGGVELPGDLTDELRGVAFDPCIAVLARPTGGVDLPGGRGLVRLPDDDVLDVVADNKAKGISKQPAVTIHASATWTRDHWDDDDDVVGPALVAVARDLLGTSADVVGVHRWRYAAPTSPHHDLAPGGSTPGPLRFAGDAFAGGRVEGAALSGWTAAHRLLEAL